MPLYKFNSHPAPGFHADGSLVVDDLKATGNLKPRSKIITANSGFGGYGGSSGGAGYGDSSSSASSFGGGQSSADVDRYNPVRDRLDEGSIVEDWIPRDASGLDEMFKLMYNRDYIAGVVVDMIADMLWSDYDLVGIQDPVILNIYRDTMQAIDPIATGPEITREYLVLGRSISSMIFDKTRGIFNDIISHDPSFVKLTPIPMKGFDPKIDLIPSPAMRAFVESNDPRDVDARRMLPQAYIDAIRTMGGGSSGASGFRAAQNYMGSSNRDSGGFGIPLDPINTLFLPRRSFGHDNIGTSLFTRLITFWALEKALINATASSARRRSRSILHIKAGIDNIWEPTAQEMDNIAGMFIQADEDPVGAVVVTRTGIDTNEVRAGQDFYKWADEWSLLNEGKLRALGLNDAILQGDATYSNQESAQMFFVEKIAKLREILTQRIFYNKLFPLMARIHGFRKRTTAELAHKIRINATGDQDPSKGLTQRQALEIPDSELIMPTISWRKELLSDINEKKLDIYTTLEEKGIPIHLRDWAAAGGVDLDAQIIGLEADAELRKQVATWKASFESTESESAEEEAKLEFVRSLKQLAQSSLKQALGSRVQELGPLASYIFWDANATVGPLTANDLVDYLGRLAPGDNSYKVLGSMIGFKHDLFKHFQHPIKVEIAHFLLYRSGLTPLKPTLDNETISILSTQIKNSLDQYASHGNVYQLAKIAEKELSVIGALSSNRLVNKQGAINSKTKNIDDLIKSRSSNELPIVDKVPEKSSSLYSGY